MSATEHSQTSRDGSISSGQLPALRFQKTLITPAQIATFFTVPVTLVRAVTNRIIIPTQIHIRKEAGSAWTMGASGFPWIGYPGSPNSSQFALLDQTATNLYFGASEAVWVGEAGRGQFRNLGDTTSQGGINSAALVMSLQSADPSVAGTGNIHARIWYRIWPGLGVGF